MGNDNSTPANNDSSSLNAHRAKVTSITYNSDSKNSVKDKWNEFMRLNSIEKQVIKKITTKVGEILIENFISLSLITNKLQQKTTSSKLPGSTEYLKWLTSYAKLIYKLQKRLRVYRSSVVNLVSENLGKTETQNLQRQLKEISTSSIDSLIEQR